MTDMWTEKYRPKTTDTMVMGQDLVKRLVAFVKVAFAEINRVNSANKKIRRWNADIKKQIQSAKLQKEKNALKKLLKKELTPDTKKIAIMLRGPPGIGKTTSVLAIGKSMNVPVIETNASDARTAKHIRDILVPASKFSDITSFMTSGASDRIIMIDEVDGMSGTSDRGGIQELIKVIQNTSYPIVLIANEWKKNLQSIYNKCQVYDVPRPSVTAIQRNLEIIAKGEGLGVSKNDLLAIAKNAMGDFRAAIYDLQMMSSSKRDQLETIWDTVRGYFGASDPISADIAFRGSTTEMQLLYRWIVDNMVPRAIPDSVEDACSAIARADMILGHIHELEEWSMIPQFVEILKSATIFLRNSKDRLQKPSYFRDTTVKLDDVMNAGKMSRDEAFAANLLLTELYKKNDKKYKKLKIKENAFIATILSRKY